MKIAKYLIISKLDSLIYGFVGPFSIIYIFPKFFLSIENELFSKINPIPILNYLGSALMWVGAVIAVWCSILMFLNKRGSPSPFSKPKVLITHGPYRIVRHPMMWSLNFVIIGEIVAWHSPFLIVWLLIWLRFSVLFIARYEEPYLISIFGEDYHQYSKDTPRWLPKFLK